MSSIHVDNNDDEIDASKLVSIILSCNLYNNYVPVQTKLAYVHVFYVQLDGLKNFVRLNIIRN